MELITEEIKIYRPDTINSNVIFSEILRCGLTSGWNFDDNEGIDWKEPYLAEDLSLALDYEIEKAMKVFYPEITLKQDELLKLKKIIAHNLVVIASILNNHVSKS